MVSVNSRKSTAGKSMLVRRSTRTYPTNIGENNEQIQEAVNHEIPSTSKKADAISANTTIERSVSPVPITLPRLAGRVVKQTRRRYRPNKLAREEILKQTKAGLAQYSNLKSPRLNFQRIARSIVQAVCLAHQKRNNGEFSGYEFQTSAVDALQGAAEAFLTEMLGETNCVALNDNGNQPQPGSQNEDNPE